MKTLHIEIDDKYLDIFLMIMNSLKEGMIKNISIDSDFTIDVEQCKNDLKKIQSSDMGDFLSMTPEELFNELDI